MALCVGIDLGTTNSAIAYVDAYDKAVIIPNADGENLTPSCVAFTEHGVVVGAEAKALKQAGDPRVAAFFKREMGNEAYLFSAGDQDYSPTDLASFVLARLKADAEAHLGESVRDAVITVPAYFRETERRATVLAAEKAGLRVVQTINEPTAAALACGVEGTSGRLLVYDLGGGTFDVTLLELAGNELRVLASEGDDRLGGKDWDERIVDFLMDAFRHEFGVDPYEDIEFYGDILIRAEDAKRRLSSAERSLISLRHASFAGRYELSREQFAGLTGDLVHRTRSLCEKLLNQLNLSPGDVDKVLLVGGSTRMPMIPALIADFLGAATLPGVNVDEAVALGAAIQGHQLRNPGAVRERAALDAATRTDPLGRAPMPRRFKYSLAGSRAVRDVTNHSLGAIAVTADGSRYTNEILLAKNTPVPCVGSKTFVLDVKAAGAQVMDVYLTQGETASPEDMTYLGKYVIRKIPGNPSRKARIEVTYRYNASGMVEVSATDSLAGTPLPVTRSSLSPGEEARFLAPPAADPVQGMAETHLLLVMDLSASMTGAPLEAARVAAHRFVNELDLSVCSVGLVVTADRSCLVCEPTHEADRIHAAIDDLEIGMLKIGFGNAAHPFALIHELLAPLADERTVAVILADGIWYCRDLAIDAAKQCHEAGIDVVAIGVGTANAKFLQSLASTDEAGIFTNLHQLSDTFSRIARVVGEAQSDGTSPRGGLLGLRFRA